MKAWQPVRVYGAGLQPHMGREWNCDPAWDVQAVYSEPDGELVSPDGTVRRFVFRNRHIDPRFHLEYPRTTREAPRVRSRTVGDPDREWEIVIEHRDRYLRDAGLALDSPPEAVAKCLADTFKHGSYFTRKPHCPTFPENPRELCNPIEGLLFQSFCVGCAHAYAALADACGFPCRTIGCGGHRLAEVRVAGRWHMVENSCRHENSRGLEAFFPAGFMEVTTHPERFLSLMPPPKAAGYLRTPNGQFHFMGGTWQCPVTIRFGAASARALYPELDHWEFKSGDGKRMPIFLRAGGFYWENLVSRADEPAVVRLRLGVTPFPVAGKPPSADFLYHPLNPGETLRQSVWLDDLAGMQGLEVTIPISPEPHVDFSSALGRQLVVKVNDFEKSLDELGAWPGTDPEQWVHRHCTFIVPADALAPHSVNWIYFENRSGTTLQAPFLPAAMEPYIAPLSRDA